MLISSIYMSKKNDKIIKKNYKFALSNKGEWDSNTLIKIRKKNIKKELKKSIEVNDKNLLFIIECLKEETKSNHYTYAVVFNSIILFSGVYLGAFLGGFSNYASNMKDFFESFRIIGGIILLTLLMILYVEFTMRDFIIQRRKNKYLLIRVLENIYLEETQKTKR